MKVAIVHYWLVGMRGGEKVIHEMCKLFPEADIYTLVVDRTALSDEILKHRITPSFLQNIGGVKHYQKMLPLMPFALEAFDLTGYDVVISSEAGPAKAVVTRPDAVHICYCHSPMRYLWDCSPQYISAVGKLSRLVMYLTFPLLRQWDVLSASRVDHFLANSRFVAQRIQKYYRREAFVIHPPVEVDRFSISDEVEDFYLCAGQITPYKKVEMAVEACTQLGRRLVVLGSGATKQLKAMAGPTVEFHDRVDDATMERHFSTCRALLYPGVEDFGIVPLEVMASGRPVVGLARGGLTETAIHKKTGWLYQEQSTDALKKAILEFEAYLPNFSPLEIRKHALSFNPDRFRGEIANFVQTKMSAGDNVLHRLSA